jgi:iron complex outermembrane recepter protein
MRNVNGAMLLRLHRFSFVIALLGAGIGQNANAQSAGTEALEEVVVSASRRTEIGMLGVQTAPKSRVTINSEYLKTQAAGQTVFQSINQVPGVNFTSSDAYGTSGGNLRIRGFDGSRVAVTFDGIPLNDSGNYALYPNQMLDPELIDRVDVNLGTTDVDSPTASATGGTVSYRSRRPTDDFGGEAVVSGGTDNYKRALLRVDTGEWGSSGITSWFAASYQKYDKFKGPGELERKQLNAYLRKDFENGDFITFGAHYNDNRNAFYRTTSDANFQLYGRDYDYLVSCTRDAPDANVVDNENATNVASGAVLATDNLANPSSCTNYYGVRINPSNTGNFRMQSLWHLTDKVILTFDPSWQYTLANGGGTTTINETIGTTADVRPIGATTLPGYDLNGDGDTRDSVRFYTPNNTNTKRWGATTSVIWDLNEDNRFRVAYTWDRARHRQTGQWGYIDGDGPVEDVFGGRKGERVYAADGDILRGRDRFSIAELSQFAVEWRGQFDDDRLTATLGLRAPDFTRELNQYCYTPNGGTGNSGNTIAANNGSTLCTSHAPTRTLANGNVVFQPASVTAPIQFIAPWSDKVKFDDVLPNVGLSFTPWDAHQFYLSYAEGLSAPRTDNLYAVTRLDDGSVGTPTPEVESTKAYDLGWRFNGTRTIASVAVWKIDYKNRIVSAFDPELGFSVDRNVGDVDMWGAEAQGGQRFGNAFTLTGSVSYTKSKVLDNLPYTVNPQNQQLYLPLEGNALVETPEWQAALRADYEITEGLHLGLQGKWVDERFSTDLNDETTPAYTVVDLDANYTFKMASGQALQFQLNFTNLLDEDYYGNISSGVGRNSLTALPCLNDAGQTVTCVNRTNQTLFGGVGFFSIGAPRTVMVSVKYDF